MENSIEKPPSAAEIELAALKALLAKYLSYGSTDGKVERRALRVELAEKVGVPVPEHMPR